MTQVAILASPIEPMTAASIGSEVYNRFEGEPDTMAIAVVDKDNVPIGLIDRGQFMLKMGGAYGRSLYSGRSVTLIMDANPLCVDVGTRISQFMGETLAHRPSDLLRGFVVVNGGRYAGVGTTAALLQAAHDESQRQSADLAKLTQAAIEDRSRWSMLFHQSPLPQMCVDASNLFEILSKTGSPDTGIGVKIRDRYEDLNKLFEYIDLREANEAAHSLFGVDGFQGSVSVTHFEEGFLTELATAAEGMDVDGAIPPFDAVVRRKDGRCVDVRVHLRTLAGGARPWSICMATFVDMTEVRRAAIVEREARQAAQAANGAKTEFLATMSHEIRTPLNGVLGMAQVMAIDELSPVQRGRIDVIRKSGEALLLILNDILDLSKIEAGRLDLESAPFDIAGLTDGVAAIFVEAARAKAITFTCEVDDEVKGQYVGDVARLRQVLSNLVSNAVKFTEVGNVTLRVTKADDGLRFIVSDTGVGISPDRAEKVFEKFVQADSSTTRRFGGTGLGLAISREIVDAMGGAISVESTLGRGSTFRVDLPLSSSTDTDACPVQPATLAAIDDAVGGAGLRILAAEDNEINQLVLRTILQQLGIEPTIVANGREAVEAWMAQDWDLILMDIQMPEMDGPTAARRIRALEQARGGGRTPILALTANAMRHQAETYLAAGMDGIVAKPIQISELMAAMDAALTADHPMQAAMQA